MEEERAHQAKEAVSQYQGILQGFKQEVAKEVAKYHNNIVSDVEAQLAKAFDMEAQ